MKKPSTVVVAEAALAAKSAEVVSAKETLERLKAELSAAYVAVRDAQTEADAALPQCRLVLVRWRSGTEEGDARVVILRRTPGGMLVVRHVGDPRGAEYRFKWAPYAGRYKQAERATYTSDTRELRDVPAEYMPCEEPTA